MSDWNNKIIAEFHEKGGKGIGHFGDRLLLLTVKGRKSGSHNTIPLAYHMDGDRYVVAASKGGSPDHPQWYRNLVAHPDVTVQVGTEKFRARAKPFPRGPERDRLYADHGKMMSGFLDYEKKTKRIIPAIVLERV